MDEETKSFEKEIKQIKKDIKKLQEELEQQRLDNNRLRKEILNIVDRSKKIMVEIIGTIGVLLLGAILGVLVGTIKRLNRLEITLKNSLEESLKNSEAIAKDTKYIGDAIASYMTYQFQVQKSVMEALAKQAEQQQLENDGDPQKPKFYN